MVRNYFKIFLRTLWRNKTFGIINISGLAIGMAASILILLWVQSEWNMNRFHSKLPQLYSVLQHQTFSDGQIATISQMPGAFADAIESRFPEIRRACKLSWPQTLAISFGDNHFKEKGYYATSGFLEMFSFPLSQGDTKSALQGENSIVISERLAKKLFNHESPVGKTVRLDNKHDFTINAVLKDVPVNSSLQFDFLLPHAAFVRQYGDWVNGWDSNSFPTFVELHANTDGKLLANKLKDFFKSIHKGSPTEPFLQPFEDLYLYNTYNNGVQEGGRIAYVRLFSITAILTLLIAAINFMNLTTALAQKRSREIGVRKVIGADRKKLIVQFLSESMCFTFLSLLIAVVLIQFSIPFFNGLTGKKLDVEWSNYYLLVFSAVGLFTGLASGSYPAFYLSAFKPVTALKGEGVLDKRRRFSLRKVLVVSQFTFSVILIFCTIVIYQQVQYVKNQKLGYRKENVVFITQTEDAKKNYAVIKQALHQIPGVENVSRAMSPVVDMWNATYNLKWPGKLPDEKLLVSTLPADDDIIETLGMTIKEGRAFSSALATDSFAVVLNEEAVRLMGMHEPLKEVVNWGIDLKIVGVVENFHFNNLFARPGPLMIMLSPPATNFIFVRFTDDQNVRGRMEKIARVFKEYDPGHPFEYKFLDEEFNKKFESESMLGILSGLFALLAILISCFGLFGLTTFSAEHYTKEIGVRKVFGASVSSIVLMLSKDFIVLVLVALLISAPIAWYMVNQWLHAYEYRVDISWWIFAVTAAGTLLITLLTTGFQSIKSALTNPVDSLRNE